MNANAKKLIQAADKLAGEIKSLRAGLPHRRVNTPKYVQQAKDKLLEVLKMEMIEDRLRACASLWEAPDTLVPPPKTRAEVERLIDAQDEFIMGIGTPTAGQPSEADKLMVIEWDLVSYRVMGYWPTPANVVKRMIELANIQVPDDEHLYILEPSAGKGNIAQVLRDHFANHPITLHCVEIDPKLAEVLRLKGFTVFNQDIFDYGLANKHHVNYVFLNPPFEKGQDIKHIQYCFDQFLQSDGTLVAICGEGAFRNETFVQWIEERGFWVKLPPNAFKDAERSTGTAMRIIVVSKGVKPIKPPDAEPQLTREEKRFSLPHILYDMKLLELQRIGTEAALNASMSSILNGFLPPSEEIMTKMEEDTARTLAEVQKMAANLGLRLEHRGYSIGQKVRNTQTNKESIIRELADEFVYVNEINGRDKDQYPAWSYEVLGEPEPHKVYKLRHADKPEEAPALEPQITPEEHYAQEVEDGLGELKASGIQIGDRVRMIWDTCPDTYATVLSFSEDNPAWIFVEEEGPDKRRFSIAVSSCQKVDAAPPSDEPIATLGIASTYVYATFQELVDDLVEQLEDDDLDLCWDQNDWADIYRKNAPLITSARLRITLSEGETFTRLALSLMGVSDDKRYVHDLREVWYQTDDIEVLELADWALWNLDQQAHTACHYLSVYWRWQFVVKLYHYMTQPPMIAPAPVVKSVTDAPLPPPERSYTYAINLSDLEFLTDERLKAQLKEIATLPRKKVSLAALRQAQGETALLAFDCPPKEGWSLIIQIRAQYDKSQLRLYKSPTGYGGWQPI